MTSEALARIQPRAVLAFDFSEEQRKIIRDTYLNGASDQEAAVLMEIARARRLNPLTRQIHFIKRWDNQKRCEVWSAQVAIDGLRAIAERTGLYDGQDEPEFEETEKGIKLCKVRVYRKDWSRPAVGVAYWVEYAQTGKDGNLTSMWARGKHFMLAKCAEALALRKAFPEDTSGLYTPEEMGNDAEVSAAQPAAVLVEARPSEPPASGGRTTRASQVAERMKPLPAPAPIIDVASGETEEAAKARQQAATLLFGARKGVAISSLSAEQLGEAVDWARQMLEDKPNAKNSAQLLENLEQLELEIGKRMSEVGAEG